MPVKVKIDRSQQHSVWWSLLRIALAAVLVVAICGGLVFAYYYHHYSGLLEQRLKQGPLFASVAQIYAAPQEVRPGQQLAASDIAASLRRAGYNTNPQMGTYRLEGDTIQVKPGPESYLAADGATIVIANGQVQTITAENGAPLAAYKLEPQLITALSEDKGRTKRRMVTYSQIPPRMVQAVLAIEDRRFFEHGGVDYESMISWAWHDLIGDRKHRGGASTLTMQLAKLFFLEDTGTIKYKLTQIMITFQLEHRFTKQQIFEMYANEVNLGQRGSFAIQGIGEASQAYFGKDLRQLDLAQTATIAGIINRPNWLDPYRHPIRAMTRRNLVLDSMVETGAISRTEAERAEAEPLNLAPPNVDASEAPYFIDLVHDQIVQRLGDTDIARSGSLRIYTSLDPQLQIAAQEAVDEGMKNVDELVRKRHRKGEAVTYPQVALIALNPHTGQVLALVGGRNYSTSQLDHALAERPTGSTFKPFVYAAAFNTSIAGTDLNGNRVFTALTRLNDDPTTFMFNGKPYTPGNFVHGEYPGMVTAGDALAHSLNIATIALAEQVGYGNVAALGRSAGIVNARGTPSVAIGAYTATPLELAGAYTIFANNGVHLKPWILASVRNPNGDILADFAPEAQQVLDPRVAFLTQSLLEGVMNRGTGISVRQHGFTAPAAGKTGTEHDAWFAGYSSNLLCVVWIGNDDYTDIKLQGADAAAPIWAGFMGRAIRIPQYSDMKPLGPVPDGVEVLQIDRATDLPADSSCPSDSFTASFLIGTAPQGTCSQMGEDSQTLGNKLFNNGQPDDGTQHRNFFQKLFGLGKDKQQQQQPPQPQTAPQ